MYDTYWVAYNSAREKYLPDVIFREQSAMKLVDGIYSSSLFRLQKCAVNFFSSNADHPGSGAF
jgi:hypothetical protein